MKIEFIQISDLLSVIPDVVSAVLISLVTAFIAFLFRPRVKVIYGSTNWSLHEIEANDGSTKSLISSEKIYVQNMGKVSADNIEIVLTKTPFSYKLWPPRDYTEQRLKDGKHSVTIPFIAPKELLIVDILDTGQ